MDHKKAAGTLLLSLLLMLQTFSVFAAPSTDVLTCVTTGQMRISGQNIPVAKKRAVSQALESAVQNAFASLVSRQVFASNLEFLYDRLLPRTNDYVTTYRVLDGIQHKGKYLVGVESKIDLVLLEKRLKDARILKAGKDKPVLLLLIAEQTPKDILPRYWWGNNPQPYSSVAQRIIKTQMAANRVLFANAGADYPDPSFYSVQFESIYDVKAAMDLGRAMKADMVILGKATASESFNRMGDEKPFDAAIELQVYDLASGRAVLQSTSKATAKGLTDEQGAEQALTMAAQNIGQDLGQKIDSFWSQNLRKENSFDVVIEGENFLPRFIALKKRFKEIRDIENMQPKEIGSAHAVMEIVYKGSPEQFANAVLLKTFDGFGLELAEVTPEQVKIRFVENQETMVPEPAGLPAEPVKPAETGNILEKTGE